MGSLPSKSFDFSTTFSKPLNLYIIAAAVTVATAITIALIMRNKQKFVNLSDDPSFQLGFKPGFLPSHQGPYFQGMPPSLKVENDYHSLMLDECKGDYGNFECRQKSYLKAMKAGTTDKADLICSAYADNEDRYYQCLDGVYGNYQWADRYVGVDGPCLCENGATGSLTGDTLGNISCFCPSDRDLHDRRPVDINDEIVDRI